ncbi:MAG TPA: MFS transporter, partial [Ktedonobacterales bacterium]|nr:MFS transporter [Ktedonobacterales bacterium]
AMDGARAVLIALLLLATNLIPLPFSAGGRLGPLVQLGAIYAIVVLAGGCAQFFNPGRLALVGDIVAERERSRASGMTQTVSALSFVIGPALAAPLFFAAGVRWALLINALSFVVSFVALRAVRAPPVARGVAPGQAGNVGGEFRAGLRFFARNRALMTILITIVLILLGGGALNALDIFFVTQNLHVAPRLYGNLEAAYGAGAVVGALLATLVARRLGAARLFWLSVLLMAAAVVVLSRLTSYYPALVVQFLIGVPNAAMNAAVGPILLHVTPRQLVGRMAAIINPVATLVGLLSAGLAGYLLSGVMHDFHATLFGLTFGPVDTIFAVAGAIGMLGALYAWAGLRGIRLAGERGGPVASALPEPAMPDMSAVPVVSAE